MAIDGNRRGGSLGGIPLKHLSLITLTFQNSALILIMHYSRIMPLVNGQRYLTSTSVFLNEVIKLAISLTMALYDMSANLPANTPATILFENLVSAVFTNESWKLAIPALLYTLQNTLQYVAVSNLDAATFQVTYQLKILTTAIFSVILLRRSLSSQKWASLCLLVIGVAIVQFPHSSDHSGMNALKDTSSRIFWPRTIEELQALGSTAAAQLTKRSATYEGIEEDVAMQNPQMNTSVGLVAVLVACAISGLAGVTFEKILKESTSTNASLWVRNVQLSFWSIFPALFIGVIFMDGEKISKTGFFAGYNWIVWTAITFQACGGVIVAMVINYADNIAKNFATSISIIISFLASVIFFNFSITASYLIGTCVVLFATYLYTSQDRIRPPPIRIADYEKTTIDAPRDPVLLQLTVITSGRIRIAKHSQSEILKPVIGDRAYRRVIHIGRRSQQQGFGYRKIIGRLSGVWCIVFLGGGILWERLKGTTQWRLWLRDRRQAGVCIYYLEGYGERWAASLQLELFVVHRSFPVQYIHSVSTSPPHLYLISSLLTMGDGIFDLLDELEHREAGRQYSLPRSKYILPPRPLPSRDRYRAPRHTEEPKSVGLEGMDEDGSEMPFDSFGQFINLPLGEVEHANRPYEDRQRQAAQGKARLSLASRAPRYLTTVGAPSPSQAAYHGGGESSQAYFDGKWLVKGPDSQPRIRNLPQFGFSATQLQESGPDLQFRASSSPAFRASQRRAEDHHAVVPKLSNRSTLDGESVLYTEAQHRRKGTLPSCPKASQKLIPNQLALPHAPPMAQGIPLIPRSELPDRLRTVFPFDFFNAVQSKCFKNVYKSDDNFVLSSPTGSGKTAILELAICRAISTNATGQYKIVYQAPTKALCSERQRDWQKKFNPLGLQCAELTGDSDNANLRAVQSANIIVTTPEKWDSITRKWKDHEKLMQLIRLFLIDEVHILNEDRGATLETVVSRMKTIGTDVRFVALSATVPNFEDVATWLGKNSQEPFEPANNERFGEEFRPVKLKKHVCGYQSSGNEFVFEKFLDGKLPEVITKYSERKPMMVFCVTRNSTVSTAKMLANWWISRSSQDRHWKKPSKALHFRDSELRNCVASGVAFHHAGLEPNDRQGVEEGFLKGDINVICCTSTLAVGVNLPCHFVIIKNTMSYTNTGLKEYADLEVMQMLGRAGRPQFDNSAIAVIMTRQQKVRRYELMVTGQDILESCLHLNLVDHLNAEVGLRTIRDLTSAKKWLAGTFLYVRLKQNPNYYKLEGARSGQDVDEQLDDICSRDITLLQDTSLVTKDQHFKCTEFGDAMARYYVQFDTMRAFLGLEPKTKISEMVRKFIPLSPKRALSAIAQAAEFKEIRFRAGEKPFYKSLNQSPSIRFPIPVNLDAPAQKVSLILQSVLGGADMSFENGAKIRSQYTMEMSLIFKHVHRLIRCIIDCQICLGDSVAVRNALMLERSLSGRAWDDSPLQLKQIEQIGVVAVRKLVNAGIRSIEELENTEPHRIEMILGKNPPFGMKLLDRLKPFPKLRVSVHVQPTSISRTPDGVKILVKAEIGFLNENPPSNFQQKPIYVCLLAETSDERLIHFARISGFKLGKGQDLTFLAHLTGPDQYINCYVMCDGLAGTMRGATVKPNIPASRFTRPRPHDTASLSSGPERPTSNMSRRRIETMIGSRRSSDGSDEFGLDGIDDDDLVKASFGDLDFDHIENYANPNHALTRKNTTNNTSTKGKGKSLEKSVEEDEYEPKQLENGKWACNHKCKDKKSCKHYCCKEGTDKPPKKPVKKVLATNGTSSQAVPKKKVDKVDKTQTRLYLTPSKRKTSTPIEVLDLTQQEKKRKLDYARNGPIDYRNLHQLHQSVQKKDSPASISSIMHKKPTYCYSAGEGHSLSFLDNDSTRQGTAQSSDYGDIQMDDISTHFDTPEIRRAGKKPRTQQEVADIDSRIEKCVYDVPSDHHLHLFDDDDSALGEAMVSLKDCKDFQAGNKGDEEDLSALAEIFDVENGRDLGYQNLGTSAETCLTQYASLSPVKSPTARLEKSRSSLLNDTSSPQPSFDGFKSAKSMLKGSALVELKQVKDGKGVPRTKSTKTPVEIGQDKNEHIDSVGLDVDISSKQQHNDVPEAFRDLEPWLYAEFGDIVEIIDG
ncbi:uncharacterized protein BDR25DRAFT_394820 [Lindgomyces ingoldianus]|uniref:Uncharacterized protein n=1 Tax=Lindgomyces ingoldianus TaxID=673940 RepID=A0ACB6QNY9_9PLEO|nr:uncharacterized protein BDR25DRAFT_394820 [Lindgomyces ingoldianus]KAF2468631.1 hypothetical protein BDR25DRAFT_394820 [Lindgomyces ingoldianus]